MLLENLHAGVVLVFNQRVFVILTFAFIRVLMLVVLTPPPLETHCRTSINCNPTKPKPNETRFIATSFLMTSPVLMNRVLIFGPRKKQERGIKKSDVENSAEN